MCGISGYINLNRQAVENTEAIISMLRTQRHRGPDDSGIRVFNLNNKTSMEVNHKNPTHIEGDYNGVIGFNRLSILDLSVNGHQPMMSPDEKVILTLNGEIYNAFDYKDELINWGYQFKSTSDTEVVLALYLKYGIDGLLERLNGMFAIVIADLSKSIMHIARDRFGIKPMYYIFNNQLFAFSSELKTFRYLPGFSYQIEEDQLNEYMLFRNNLKNTLFKDILVLNPGFYLSVSPDKQPELTSYFKINHFIRNSNSTSSREVYEKMLEICLSKSTRRQLISDVKVGCQLSGGIDSSLVTYYANRNSTNTQFESVSIIFSDPSFNEEPFIDQVSNNLNVPSHKFLLDADYYLKHFEKATWHLEQPINHPNTIGIYLLSQRAKEYVTVLLSGEGADEVFGGYRRYYDISYPFRNKVFFSKLKNILRYPHELKTYIDPAYRAILATAFMPLGIAEKLRNDFDFKSAIKNREALYKKLDGSLFDKQVKYEMMSYLPDLLIRQDKMSMAHSIENRVPFLDNEMVNFAFNTPSKYLLIRKSAEGYNNEKYMLKKIAARIFDNNFAFRNKMGFGIPVRQYFNNPDFNEYLNDKILPGIKTRGIFNYSVVSDWLKKPGNITYQQLESLWIVVAFEIWASIYIDQPYENWNTFIS
ncbi:MAG TPA: asparagine synthase (glutamine-hydrolyzing) [Bacteroidales bacterium]|nr:asparagine synthase (glutamine-hydrolyzing) [Bacteroidales bacterium]